MSEFIDFDKKGLSFSPPNSCDDNQIIHLKENAEKRRSAIQYLLNLTFCFQKLIILGFNTGHTDCNNSLFLNVCFGVLGAFFADLTAFFVLGSAEDFGFGFTGVFANSFSTPVCFGASSFLTFLSGFGVFELDPPLGISSPGSEDKESFLLPRRGASGSISTSSFVEGLGSATYIMEEKKLLSSIKETIIKASYTGLRL